MGFHQVKERRWTLQETCSVCPAAKFTRSVCQSSDRCSVHTTLPAVGSLHTLHDWEAKGGHTLQNHLRNSGLPQAHGKYHARERIYCCINGCHRGTRDPWRWCWFAARNKTRRELETRNGLGCFSYKGEVFNLEMFTFFKQSVFVCAVRETGCPDFRRRRRRGRWRPSLYFVSQRASTGLLWLNTTGTPGTSAGSIIYLITFIPSFILRFSGCDTFFAWEQTLINVVQRSASSRSNSTEGK